MYSLSEALRGPLTPPETLVRLRDAVGFSDREIGRALGVNPRSIKRWRAGAAINSEGLEALFDLLRLVVLLAELAIPAANIHAWFLQRNGFLNERRPIDAFAEGGYEDVCAAIDAISDGAYG